MNGSPPTNKGPVGHRPTELPGGGRSASLLALLHLCDSLFPIGAFSHSDGLEAATSRGDIATPDDLRLWMDATLTETLVRLDGPALCRAWLAVDAGRFASLTQVDDEVHAIRASSAGREASRAMGSRLVRTWQQIRPDDRLRRLLSERAAFTLPVAFGAVTAASDIPRRQALEGFIYTRLAAAISAAMRLMPLGQQEGHHMLADTLARVPALVGRIADGDEPLRSFAPALDVAAMSQQYGHSRLFRS